MTAYFESQWYRPPTPQEFQALVEDKIKEEVLHREGLDMELDKGDTIVKRRMAQKMQFLAEDVVAAHEPSTAELKAWFEKNTDKFALPSRYSFRHIYFSPDKRGTNAYNDAAQTLARIAGQPENSPLIPSAADRFMFQDYYGDRTPSAIAKEFGPQFAVALEKIKASSWQGPIESGYGWHLVFVDTVIPGRVPAFDGVESEVKTRGWVRRKRTLGKSLPDDAARYTVFCLLLPTADCGRPGTSSQKRDSRYLRRRAVTGSRSHLINVVAAPLWGVIHGSERRVPERRTAPWLPSVRVYEMGSKQCRLWLVAIFLLASLLAVSTTQAHEARPAYLEIKETSPNQFSVLWRTPVLAGMACRLS